MLPAPVKFEDYCKKVAIYLRAREANFLRGRPEQLEQLDQLTDLDLLKKWSWMSAIVGGIGCVAGMLLVSVLSSLLPVIVTQLLWALEKVALGLVCFMIALAAYFTFFMSIDSNRGV